MKKVWKFELETAGEQRVMMPLKAEILSVQVQRGIPCLWALVDPDQESDATETRTFLIFGTGHPIPEQRINIVYVGTYQQLVGNFIGHIFEKINSPCRKKTQTSQKPSSPLPCRS
jgi:hypothetical protein